MPKKDKEFKADNTRVKPPTVLPEKKTDNINGSATEIKNANASGQGSMERNDQDRTGTIPDQPANEENNDE